MRSRRLVLAVGLVAVVAVGCVTGCVPEPSPPQASGAATAGDDPRFTIVAADSPHPPRPPQRSGDVTVEDGPHARWMREQPGALDAWVERRAGRTTEDVRVVLDPEIADRDLVALTEAALQRVPGATRPDGPVVFWYSLGDDRRFSSVGGGATLDDFRAYRTMSDVESVSARGGDPDHAGAIELTVSETSFIDVATRALLAVDDLRGRPDPAAPVVTGSDGRATASASAGSDLYPLLGFAMAVPEPIDVRRVVAADVDGRLRVEVTVGDDDDRTNLDAVFEGGTGREGLELVVAVAAR